MKHFKALVPVRKLVKVQHKVEVGDLVEMYDGHDYIDDAKITKITKESGMTLFFRGMSDGGEGFIYVDENGARGGMYKTDRWGSYVSHLNMADNSAETENVAMRLTYDKAKCGYYYSTYEYQETEEVRNIEAGHHIKVTDYQTDLTDLQIDAVIYTEKYAMIVAHSEHGMLYSATLNVSQYNDRHVILYTPTHSHGILTNIEFR